MKVVVKKAGQPAEVREIKNELSALQEIVGGHIECVGLGVHNILLICNEEGKLIGLPPNFGIGNDTIVGDVFFCSEDKCDFNSLNDSQIEFLMRAFG